MSTLNDYFKPESLFSRDNPFLKSAEKTHQLIFGALDKTARLQLAFAEDLLDINSERYQSLYQQQSFSGLFEAQRELMTKLGERASHYAGELREVVSSLQTDVTDAANDLGAEVEPKPAKARSTKAKSKAAA